MTDNTARLALVVHFHQPVGNLDAVVRNATDRCYRPYLEVLSRHPGVRATLHYSGCLLEWLGSNANDVISLLQGVVRRGQVELMTGGFYEPILAALPDRDRVGQIEMLTHHLRATFGSEPRGAWLTERVWEQDVVGSMARAGVRWTVIDDTIFQAAGIPEGELTGPFVTDHNGAPLLVYPGDRTLRYLIPYKSVGRVVERIASDPGKLWVYADDGEKLGEWPGTFDRVYEEGWLDSLFAALESDDRIETVFLGDDAPRGRVYPPSSSYDEMMTWALPTEARIAVGRMRRRLQNDDPEGALAFTHGAPWRAFLAKYPEVNHLHKRMLGISERIARSDAEEAARRALYKAQCNCAYWHGAFGGAYLTFMRGALWHHLMQAEAALPRPDRIEESDIDADTRPEIVIPAPWGLLVAAPHLGGRLVEIDDHRAGANVLAGMGRHREAYHLVDENPPEPDDDGEMAAVQPRAEPPAELEFDPFGVGALIDVIDGTRVGGTYDYELADDSLRLHRDEDGLEIAKTIVPDAEGFSVTYELTARIDRALVFGIESFVSPLDLGRDLGPDEVVATETGWSVTRPEGEAGIETTLDIPASTQWDTVETASATLDGLLPMAQGTRVVTSWPVTLAPGETFAFTQRWRVLINEAASDKKERGVSA